MRQLISFLAADFISPVYSSTTIEARDRPYVTILKSVPANPCYTRTYPEVSPRQSRYIEIGGAHLFTL
jgi:hypothetical protein